VLHLLLQLLLLHVLALQIPLTLLSLVLLLQLDAFVSMQ
jgi:hypothetical protein